MGANRRRDRTVAKESLMDKFKEFLEASTESNVPMTGREIANTKARKKERATASKKKTMKTTKKSKRPSKRMSKKAGKKAKR